MKKILLSGDVMIKRIPIIDINTGKVIRERQRNKPVFYSDAGTRFLELHHHSTKNKLDVKDAPERVQEDYYHHLLILAVDTFQNRTGEDIFLLGRSGRHVCVRDTEANRRRYGYLKRLAETLERELITEFNQAEFDE